MLFNYHTHTKRCNHATGEDREYVEAAIRGGMKTLGFSDHAPLVYPNADRFSSSRMKREELCEYAENVRALAKEYQKDIRILCGFELEYHPDYHLEEMAFLRKVKPDYLILGQHFAGKDMQPSERQKDDEGLQTYVTQVLQGLATGDFLYLAHADYVGVGYSNEAVKREYTRLCQGAKKMGLPLEFNFLGVREGRRYPSRTFFEIAAQVGNDIIFGADAHSPDVVCDVTSQKVAVRMAEELGLTVVKQPLL